MRYLRKFNETFEGDKVVSDLQDIFITWQDNYDTNVVIKKWPKGEGPGLSLGKNKVSKLFGVSENDTVIRVSVSLKKEAIWTPHIMTGSGKEIKISQFEDDVNMALEYLEDLTDGEVDFYFIMDHQFSPRYCNRIDDMRDKLQNPFFNGNLIEMYFIERG
jgi:hypothetical protein